jgi:hypothetical protein
MIDIHIDKLTNSIENAFSGDRFDTEISFVKIAEINTNDWVFDWKKEILNSSRQVYKLTIKENPKIIQGLLSFEIRNGHIFLHLVENAKFNRGKRKIYVGVAGNLFAFACKCSFEKGFDGFVSFVSKSALKEHYAKTLGAKTLFGNNMAIDTIEAQKLVTQYFNN